MTATPDSDTMAPELLEKSEVKEFVINQELLEHILGEEVATYMITMGSAPGDNYMSMMHAVEVNGTF